MADEFAKWREEEDSALLATYSKFPLALKSGRGVNVFDVNDTKYLDFYGGHAVSLIGHCHPYFVEAIKKQLDELIFYSNLCYIPLRAQAAKQILSILYRNMEKIFFVNSGAEANEAALKLARNHTGRERIVSMNHSFHGRTIATLSVTGIEKYRNQFVPNLGGGTDFISFGDIDEFEQIKAEKTAAIIVEPIQSMAGAVTASADYFRALRKFATDNEILLIFDEIQTGFGRTGENFAGEHWGVEPDIVTMAKGLGGGIPASAVAVKKEIAEKVGTGEHGTTFGGGPIACAAIKATLEIIEREKLTKHANSIGDYLYTKLVEVPAITEVRGLGLLVGFVMGRPAIEIRKKLFDKGILVGTSIDPQVVRLLPPLTITREDVDVLVKALKEIS